MGHVVAVTKYKITPADHLPIVGTFVPVLVSAPEDGKMRVLSLTRAELKTQNVMLFLLRLWREHLL